MDRLRRQAPWVIGAIAALLIVTGALLGQGAWIAAGLVTLAPLGLRAWQRFQRLRLPATAPPLAPESEDEPEPVAAPRDRCAPSDMSMLIEEMLAQGRYALLLRPQIINHLTSDQLERARRAIEEGMSLTPAGEVFVQAPPTVVDDRLDEEKDVPLGRLIHVDGYYLDRYLVTNRQYRQFVAAGGYENMSLWEPEVWPALLDLVDRSGNPGPRLWKDSRYGRGQDDHPVTGICWYEAAAYARWVGKRLPSDAEWVKAAAWPVNLPGRGTVQRTHPWGDSMDRGKVNLWGSGPGTTVSVREHASGVSVGGVYQLIGNVWEWTGGDYGTLDLDGEANNGSMIKSLRGGAFDTYFDVQAHCQFQSGDYPLARKHNIGFRCALGVCDLAGPAEAEAELTESTTAAPLAEIGA